MFESGAFFIRTSRLERLEIRNRMLEPFVSRNVRPPAKLFDCKRDVRATLGRVILRKRLIDDFRFRFRQTTDAFSDGVGYSWIDTLKQITSEQVSDEQMAHAAERFPINTKLRAVLDEATDKWGIKVNRVELQDIIPPSSVLQAMEKQMQAERNKRAAILTSEGEKQSQILQSEGEKASTINRAEAAKQQEILRAEGEAQARIRKAEAEAIAIEKITEAVGKSTNPANYLLAQKYIKMMEELAQGDKTKTVFLPFEATNMLGSLGGIKELFKETEK